MHPGFSISDRVTVCDVVFLTPHGSPFCPAQADLIDGTNLLVMEKAGFSTTGTYAEGDARVVGDWQFHKLATIEIKLS